MQEALDATGRKILLSGEGGPPPDVCSRTGECGNLRRAVQVAPTEYDLVLNCDVNTRGHTQWFMFRVRNMRGGVPYRLDIINMMKPDSLFSSGMRPLLYSEADATDRGRTRRGPVTQFTLIFTRLGGRARRA